MQLAFLQSPARLLSQIQRSRQLSGAEIPQKGERQYENYTDDTSLGLTWYDQRYSAFSPGRCRTSIRSSRYSYTPDLAIVSLDSAPKHMGPKGLLPCMIMTSRLELELVQGTLLMTVVVSSRAWKDDRSPPVWNLQTCARSSAVHCSHGSEA